MVICALFWLKKSKKWRISAGFRVFMRPMGWFLGAFLVVGRVIFVTTVDFVMQLG